MKTRILRGSTRSSVGDLVAPPAGLARPREDLRARDAARAVQTLVVAMLALGKRTGLAGRPNFSGVVFRYFILNFVHLSLDFVCSNYSSYVSCVLTNLGAWIHL